MKKIYTKKQIREAVEYWERQLVVAEAADIVPLNESDDAAKQAAEQVKNDIHTPDDVKEYVEKNESVISKATGIAGRVGKFLIKAVGKGTRFILDNWKLIVIAVIIIAVWMAGGKITELLKHFRDWYMTTPAFEMHHAEGNNGLNAYFDPGGWY